MAQNIFLIGLAGSGKSSIGKYIADELGLTFYDSDQVVEDRTGADIPWIFDLEGEEGFRTREAKVIEELTQEQGIVLATGGGAILRAENRRHLGGRGIVVYLQASIEQLIQRTNKSQNRPLLVKDPRVAYEKMLQIREPLYQELADVTVDTDSFSAVSIGNKIVRIINANIKH